MLPKDDQEMEELMLEEVEVFKVGVTPPGPVALTTATLGATSTVKVNSVKGRFTHQMSPL